MKLPQFHGVKNKRILNFGFRLLVPIFSKWCYVVRPRSWLCTLFWSACRAAEGAMEGVYLWLVHRLQELFSPTIVSSWLPAVHLLKFWQGLWSSDALCHGLHTDQKDQDPFYDGNANVVEVKKLSVELLQTWRTKETQTCLIPGTFCLKTSDVYRESRRHGGHVRCKS